MCVPESDPRLRRARDWLVAHHRPDGVPGFAADTAQWTDGMRHYYQAAAARALGPDPGRWREELTAHLLATQRRDGSWQNASFLMKEDDPLIATTFALMALAAAR
jgi:hypothetical protein